MLNTQHKVIADSFQLFLSNHTAILEQRKQNLMFANMQPHHFEHCTATCPNHKSFWFITPALNFLLKNLVWVMISIERGATSQFTATYMLLHRKKCKKKYFWIRFIRYSHFPRPYEHKKEF